MIPPCALRYGKGHLTFRLGEGVTFLEHGEPVRNFNQPAFAAGLASILPPTLPSGPVAIVVTDKTRLCGYDLALPWLVEALAEWGLRPEQLTFFIAYGTHAAQTEEECLAAYGPLFHRFPFRHHRADDPSLFVHLATTRQGTPVRVRRDLLAADLVIVWGPISHHYFAGFGGGRKLLFPGLGEMEAIYANHALFLDREHGTLAAGCQPGRLVGNPLAEDLAEVNRHLPPYLAIHGLLDSHGRVASFRFGRSYDDFLAVCDEHDRAFRATDRTRYDLVLASAGGDPKDINLIQAHKAIHHAAAFVRDNGRLIVLAQCREGVGSTSFLPYFRMGADRAFTELCRTYTGNGGTALAMMTKTARIRIDLVTALDQPTCELIGVGKMKAAEVQTEAMNTQGSIAVIANSSMLVR